MNGKPVEVASLDMLVADPSKVTDLSPEVARAFLISLAALQPVLIQQSLRENGHSMARETPERFLTVEEASTLFGVTARWLYAHKRQLPHSQPSRKVLLFPEEKLRRWFAAHKAS